MASWKVLESRELIKLGFFRLREDRCQLPDGRIMPQYYVLEFADWVNVLPITTDGQVVAVSQYRHGSRQVHLEIPGGSLHPKISEEPIAAARRELLEETGYESAHWIDCGFHYPNPALQANRMHTFLALESRKVAELDLDPFEDLVVTLFPLKDLEEKLANGEFNHSLITASLAMAIPKLRKLHLLP